MERRQQILLGAGALSLLLVLGLAGYEQKAKGSVAGDNGLTKDERMAWWRDARFGMFIHWGVYSVPAGTYQGKRIKGLGEWIMNDARIPIAEYEKFAAQFNPVKFDADAWVRLARDAGVKYIVITSKHHDGFCLWDSKVTEWDIMDATPFKRDILKEMSQACKKYGVRLCFYHSIMDWHNPDAQGPCYPNYNDRHKLNPNFDRYVESYLKPQITELLTNYGPLGVMWFDGEWIDNWTEPMAKDLYAFIRGKQPTIIINNRIGKGRGIGKGSNGMDGMSKGQGYAGDFGTPEQQVPATGLPGVDWESCMTMNDTWGFKSYDDNWKSSEELIRTLVDAVSKGGNFLLNVGPTSEGLIPEPSVERLKDIGRWMAVNSESIYGTSASSIGRPEWGRCTGKGDKLYLHVFDWPARGRLTVPLAGARVSKAYLLSDKGRSALAVSAGEKEVTVSVPAAAPDAIDSVIVLVTNNQ